MCAVAYYMTSKIVREPTKQSESLPFSVPVGPRRQETEVGDEKYFTALRKACAKQDEQSSLYCQCNTQFDGSECRIVAYLKSKRQEINNRRNVQKRR